MVYTRNTVNVRACMLFRAVNFRCCFVHYSHQIILNRMEVAHTFPVPTNGAATPAENRFILFLSGNLCLLKIDRFINRWHSIEHAHILLSLSKALRMLWWLSLLSTMWVYVYGHLYTICLAVDFLIASRILLSSLPYILGVAIRIPHDGVVCV